MTSVPGRPQCRALDHSRHGDKILAEDAFLASELHIPKTRGFPGPLYLCPQTERFCGFEGREPQQLLFA